MNLGEFRRLTAGLPDEYEIVTSPGDATWWEVSHDETLAPVASAPGLVTLRDGQEITEQYLLPIRLGLDGTVDLEARHVPDLWEVQHVHTGEWHTWADVRPPYIPECLIVTARPDEKFWENR